MPQEKSKHFTSWFFEGTVLKDQKILDEVDEAATIYTPGSVREQLTRSNNVSAVLACEHFPKMGKYEEEIIKAARVSKSRDEVTSNSFY